MGQGQRLPTFALVQSPVRVRVCEFKSKVTELCADAVRGRVRVCIPNSNANLLSTV